MGTTTQLQPDLFGSPIVLPEGFRYRQDLLASEEESALVAQLRELDFKPFQFQGHEGNRRVVSFGLHYDFADGRLKQTREIPSFLLPLRGKAAQFARLTPEQLPHILATEYTPGAGIGWHRDRPVFGDVIGVSFLSECRFRFRRRVGAKWERAAQILAPRSIYLMRGPARTVWEHSIPAGDELRYSVTFRTLKDAASAE
ncbi:alpha-ketoglutarate-dependent dioxygenase AlkB [Mesorhizobium sp. 1B3]|uniref:alpha-ketoglutarate-dependent dioxygenase AlkB n=1 Tax=Mesorhizobium sp. 1B3 TaxID=3243599 RepID=UPI003D96A169